MNKIFLEPSFGEQDKGDGGVRRVIEALRHWLPEFGWEIVGDVRQAELANIHIAPTQPTRRYLEQFTDIPLVASSHGYYWAEYEWPNWCEKANEECMELLRQATAATAPTEWVAQTMRRNSLRRVEVVGHGIELEDWPERDDWETPQAAVLWNKTRVDPVCDPEPLNRLAALAPDVPFLSTFGDESLENLVLVGRLPYEAAKDLLYQAGIYLCTARETFGIGTLEAMAAGMPILGWAWGGQTEIVGHKKEGYLAKPLDYDDLEEGLKYCLLRRAKLGKAARRKVAKAYSWKPIVGRYAELFSEALSEARRARPRVSVIVPAYKLADYLPAALESVQAQTSTDWECIVVDDASPDSCGKIADSYAAQDSRFRVIHNAENQYLAGALNAGVAAAQGRYVLALDADNLLPPEALALLADELDGDRSLHISYGNVEFLDPDGRRWHSGWPPDFRPEWQLIRRDTERPGNLIPSGAMYRREVWDLTGGYRRRWQTAEDADFWTRAVSYGFRPRRVTEADTMIYRNREDSMSRVENIQDWTNWMPWARELAAPPAAIIWPEQVKIPSYEPILVSVIIPVGPGHENLAVDAIDSVDAQTFRLWECIIVNDTGAPLAWAPSWARVINTTGRIGVAAARNLGVQESKARLFVPLDADDTLEPEALARMFEIQKAYGGYVYSDWYERWDDGKPMGLWHAPDYDASLLLEKGCLHAVTALYPKDAWRQLGGFDQELPAWEDWHFQLGLASLGICGTRIPLPLFTYRKDTGFRRSENYADFENSKAGIIERWADYIEGRKELMGCRSCGGGGGQKLSAPTIGQTLGLRDSGAPTPGPEDINDYVLVEFLGRSEGLREFRPPSGATYFFAALPSHKMKYVRRGEDEEWFASKTDFRIVQTESPMPA